jgi:hypothetical protein
MTTHHSGSPKPVLFSRRSLLVAATLATVPTYTFLRELRAAGTHQDRRLSAVRWINRQEELARALKAGTISHLTWYEEVNSMAQEVDISQLLAEISRARGSTHIPYMRDPVKRSITFIDADGQPRHLSYAAATFSFGPQNLITPHAHEHMVSAHMVVEGKLRIRTFDRVGTEEGAIVIRPSKDYIGEVGAAAAMTTEKDNVHWFTPMTTRATTFDVIIAGLDPGQEKYIIQPVDPLGGRRRSDGTIVAPVLSFEESMRRYTVVE